MRVGGVVLCGGKSSRMGRPKALLPFGPECMLQRVVRILKEVVSPIIVVTAPTQDVPRLPPDVLVAFDRVEAQGPLEGLAVGLDLLRPMADAAYVTSCDVPLLSPQFVQYLIAQLANYDAVVPVDSEFHHPLAAVYRTLVAPVAQRLLTAGRRRPLFLFDEVHTLRVPVDTLRAVDSDLHSLMNLNYHADYVSALALAGFGHRDPDRPDELRRVR